MDQVRNYSCCVFNFVRYRLFRDSCVPVDGTFVKDLRVLGRDLSRVIIVDNAVEAFSFQVENGIPIKSWFAEPEDNELPKLLNFLRPLAAAQQDVRPYLLQKFSMRERMIEARNQRKF
jgi:CTD small phosphatase-like protein 2